MFFQQKGKRRGREEKGERREEGVKVDLLVGEVFFDARKIVCSQKSKGQQNENILSQIKIEIERTKKESWQVKVMLE